MIYLLFLLLTLLKAEISVIYPETYIQIPLLEGIKLVYDNINSVFYTFSGKSNNGNYLSNMNVIGLLDNNLIQKRYISSGSTQYPVDRIMYGLEIDPVQEIIYLFGGSGSSGMFNDFWVYFITEDYWQNIDINPSISSRADFASLMITYKTKNYIAILGGINANSDILEEFYFYDILANTWIEKASYTSCTGLSLSGSQLQYDSSSGIIYLFSGKNFVNNQDKYFNGLCSYSIAKNQWTNINIASPLLNSSQGGSCLYNNSIYYIFGIEESNNIPLYNDNILFLNLANTNAGWKTYSNPICNNQACGRNLFGIACYNNLIYIAGGHSTNGLQNSFIQINLTSMNNNYLDNHINPSKRNGATFTNTGNLTYLFGGREMGEYFNDIWTYYFNISDINNNNWNLINANGVYPNPRAGHAAATQGDFIIFIGGESPDLELYSDYWLYSIINNTWKELIPLLESPSPPAITETCVMLDLPYFYYVGGRTLNNLTLDLWKYDISSNNFTLLYKTLTNDIPISNHGCYLEKNNTSGEIFIYTFFGSQTSNSDPYCGINKFTITDDGNVSLIQVIQNTINITCRTNSGYMYFNGSLFIIGGQSYMKEAFSDVWRIDVSPYNEVNVMNLNQPVYSSAISAQGKRISIFSGFSSYILSKNAASIDSVYSFELIPSSNEYCGSGLYYNATKSVCLPCNSGYYSSNQDILCIPCPIGTFSNHDYNNDITQCYPCPYGTYQDTEGSNYCKPCGYNSLCFVGSSKELKYQYEEGIPEEEEPSSYNPPNRKNLLIVIVSVFLVLFIIYVILYKCSLKLRILLSVIDLFQNSHLDTFKDKVSTQSEAQALLVNKEVEEEKKEEEENPKEKE